MIYRDIEINVPKKALIYHVIIGELNKIDVYKDASSKFIRRYPLTKTIGVFRG